MDLLPLMHTYFRGERQLGVVIAAFGLVALLMAWHVWRSGQGGLGVGLGITLGLVGLAFSGGGGFLAAKSGPQASTFESAYAATPEATVAAEVARMEGVNANWPRVKTAWTVILVVGLTLVWWNRAPWLTGVSTGLIAAAGFLMFCDVTAERRAEVYTAALAAWKPTR